MNIYAALASVFKERPGKCHFLDFLEFHIDLFNCYANIESYFCVIFTCQRLFYASHTYISP